ncbi:MAG: hypothetical protein ACLU8F_02420 [Clostridia bacterium]
MEQKGLRVLETDKTFFSKLTNTISKLLIPTRVGINGMLIAVKRNNVLKNYELYIASKNEENPEKKEQISRKYEDTYALYLESVDKYIMDSIYKKVKNNTATAFERNSLSGYYEVVHLKETEYIEYKYKKQKFLLDLDYETVKEQNKEKLIERYEAFYVSKMDSLYKALLKHFSILIADKLNNDYQRRNEIYEKIFITLEEYIRDILPIKMKIEDDSKMYQSITEEYEKYERFTVGKLDTRDKIEKNMILLGISRQLFTHSLPLVVAEQCYIKLLKDARMLVADTKMAKKREQAYNLLIHLIDDYNVKLLSTKIYWDKPQEREKYKKFWEQYKQIEKKKETDFVEYMKEKEILFIQNDLKLLFNRKSDYSRIIKIYKTKLVNYGVMRQFKDKAKSEGNYTKKKEKVEEKIEVKEA